MVVRLFIGVCVERTGCLRLLAMAASYLSVAFVRLFSIVTSLSESSSGVLGGVDISDVVENAPPKLHSF